MYRVILLLLVILAPQVRSQIVIPRPKPRTAEQSQGQTVRLTSLESFKRDLLVLQQALRGRESEDAVLRRIGEQYRDLEELILEAARQIEPVEMTALMKVARRYGNERHGDELLFQLQVRPMGSATEVIVDTMVTLLREGAKDALFHCVRSNYAGLRRSAVSRLQSRVGPEDIDLALDLSRERKLDLVQAGVSLLGSIDLQESRTRLIELLSQQPVIAGAACEALIAQREAAVPELQDLLRGPPLDRSYGFAALALASLEEATGNEYLTEDMLEGLLQELGTPDALQQTMVAIALADLAHRSKGGDGERFRAAEVVDALLAVVSPQGYVANLSSLQDLAEERLIRLTGQERPDRHLLWRSWWSVARENFSGMRRRLELTPESAHLAQLTLSQGDWRYVLRGHGLNPVAASEGRIAITLTGDQMLDLVGEIESLGFMGKGFQQSIRSPLPNTRSVELLFGGARSRVGAPAIEIPRYDRIVATIMSKVEAEKWQLYRDPVANPDARSFWEEGRRWMDEHPDPTERGARLIELILAAWPTLSSESDRRMALQQLLAIPNKRDLLREEQGLRVVDLALASNALGSVETGLLELALAAPGDQVWRQVLDALDEHYDAGGSDALPQVFALLGPDKVVESITDGRRRIRLAAMNELVQFRDVRAIPPLIEMLKENDPGIQRSAIFTLGMLRAQDARQPLVEMTSQSTTLAILRREGLVALGRIGGTDVAELLRSALASPIAEDREAAVRGLGELHERASSRILAEIFVLQGDNPLGLLARFSLQKHGALLSIPALRPHLQTDSPEVHRHVAMLLGEFQDPIVVPDLITMLEETDSLEVVALLEGITGVDLAPHNNRTELLRVWYRISQNLPQQTWLLQALRDSGVATTLTPDQLVPGAGSRAVPELSRLLVEAEQPRLRMLTSAVLREITGEDFGMVSAQTPRDTLESMAVRYRHAADSDRGDDPR